MGFFPFFIFFPASGSFSTERRAAQSFSVISVITGSETLVTKTARPDRDDRRIADYRKSPHSRLLIPNASLRQSPARFSAFFAARMSDMDDLAPAMEARLARDDEQNSDQRMVEQLIHIDRAV